MRDTAAEAFDPRGIKDQRPRLLDQAHSHATMYLESLDERSVVPTIEARAALQALNVPFPAGPSDPEMTLALLASLGSAGSIATAGGRYFGFVIGGVLPVSLAANWLATTWDQNAGMRVAAPAACAFEAAAARWVVEALGLSEGTHCSFATATTTADMHAFVAARRTVLLRHGWDVERQGLAGSPPITVIVGREVHATMYRALRVAGIGSDQVRYVPVDGQGRMRPDGLPKIEGPTIVCVQAGNVNTGAFDLIDEICDRVQPAGAWVHLDGAFGIWAAASSRLRHLVRGIEKVDSAAADAHKWLNTPYDCGVVTLRDPRPLAEALSLSAEYLVQSAEDPMNTTLEASRRARGIEVWAALHSLGRTGLEAMLDRSCDLATRFAEGLRRAGHSILNDVQLNQVLVSFGDAERTRRVIAAIQEEGTCWAGATTWQGHVAMRISVSSWATTEEDVDRSLEAILRLARSSS